jgi:hypothetical protein
MPAHPAGYDLWPLGGHGVEEMSRQSPNAGIGRRTQQAGTLLAATVMPVTFREVYALPASDDQLAAVEAEDDGGGS